MNTRKKSFLPSPVPPILRISSHSWKDHGLLGPCSITPVSVPRWLHFGNRWVQSATVVECRTVLQK